MFVYDQVISERNEARTLLNEVQDELNTTRSEWGRLTREVEKQQQHIAEIER